MLSRITVAICESMAGVGGKRRLSSGGTGFLAISGIIFVFLVFNIWREYWMSHFSLLQLVLSGVEGENFFLSSGWFMNWKVERQESGVSWRDTRSLIFNLEDIFLGVFSFHVHYYWKLGIGFWIAELVFEIQNLMSPLRYCDGSTLRCYASSCTVQGGY